VTVDPTGEQLAAALAGLHPPRPRALALQRVSDTEKSALWCCSSRQRRSQAFGGTSKPICLAWPLRGDCL